ncbi:DUF1810 domain-containing protein [Dongia mobilis]|jgi:uncharacterized protein (DUF1810 family)|uniref:DUF1810 domain-containing protein n=1 Tax=Dongia sp. TaxID=1977262 RepID=UPI0026F2987E
MPDPFNLQRFVEAQAPVLAAVEAELRAGRKASHWMWFIFPQLAGLGRSGTARFYAITGLDEARAYLAHPLLGQRLIHCVELVNAIEGRSVHEIFGSPDDLKFRSSVTLFRAAAPEQALFQAALDKYFGGEPDPATLALL